MNNSFTQKDLEGFASWLNLNKEALTWQGRYEEEFNAFWNYFFLAGLTIEQFFNRFNYIFIHVTIGPLSSWFTWIRNSFLCYTFIYREISLREIAERSGLDANIVSIVLRDYFISHYPEFEEEISQRLKVSNPLSPNLSIKYTDLKKDFELDGREEKKNSDSLLQSMEVTLYEEWNILTRKMEKDFSNNDVDYTTIHNKLSIKRQLFILRDVILYTLLIVALILGLRQINISWEQDILDKVSIYEPQLKWLDKTLFFQEKDEVSKKDFQLQESEIDKVETKENKFEEINFADDTRYETESEVILTSWDSLPKDFDVADLEQSGYEELKATGYRDTRYGHTKVYRVMMKSVDSSLAKDKILNLLEKYEVTRVDNVKPGKTVPGGIYYNLYVPRKYLKEFMAQVMEVDDSILYESRTRSSRNPPGMNKVFIWIKNI